MLSTFKIKMRLSYGRRGGRPPWRHYKTGRDSFPGIRLLSTRAFATGTLCRGFRRGNDRVVTPGWHTDYSSGRRPSDVPR